MEQQYSQQSAVDLQRQFCSEHHVPIFAPTDGICYHCHENIFKPLCSGGYISGISQGQAASVLITSCPHCHHTFVD